MQTFICEFDDEGVARPIRIEAESADEAIKRMRNMGMDIRRIGTSRENLAPITRTGATAKTTPEPQSRVTISVESEEDPDEQQEPYDPMGAPHPTISPMPVVPLPHIPRTFGNDQSFASIIDDDSPSDDPEPPKEETVTIDVRRRHSLLFGTHDELRKKVNDLLSNKYGRVEHLAMHPDMKGKIILAIVVEHDEKI